ncbi:hypothetical protein ES703_86853 [subsurface metagenome]
MAEEIRVRIIPGCPAIVVAETEEDREAAEIALANIECGCQVVTEAFVGEVAAEEAEEPAAEVAEEAAEVAEEAAEEPVCSIEPDKPWEESVCGVVAKEAGRQAADKVMSRLREEGLVA